VQADLPWKERQIWVNKQSNEETKREIKVIWEMFKKDPLSPLSAYCSRYVVTGFGMMTEGYTIFVSRKNPPDHTAHNGTKILSCQQM